MRHSRNFFVETKEEIDHLESISTALDIALDEADLVQLKEELIEYGYIRRKGPTGKKAENHLPSVPLPLFRGL